LHFVFQNSTCYTAFPANKNTRFPHSLGVSALAGRLFARGLSNSNIGDLEPFLERAGNFLKNLVLYLNESPRPPFFPVDWNLYKRGYLATISGVSKFIHAPISGRGSEENAFSRIDNSTERYVDPKKLDKPSSYSGDRDEFDPDKTGHFSASFIIDTYCQAVRLYGLMHDLGHLPMSHAFETALEKTSVSLKSEDPQRDLFNTLLSESKADFAALGRETDDIQKFVQYIGKIIGCDGKYVQDYISSKEYHEIRSIYIYNEFIKSYECSSDEISIKKYSELVHYLCEAIFFSGSFLMPGILLKDHENSFLYSIRCLVDGELEADRLDYTCRDGHACGLTIGKFDLSRIVENCTLVKAEGQKNRFTFSYYARALTGLEQFYEQRYQSYKYIINHRTSSRSNACLETLISRVHCHAFQWENSICKRLLHHFGYIKLENGTPTKYLPASTKNIVRIDDSNLRTMLFNLYYEIDELGQEDQFKELLQTRMGYEYLEIFGLLRIFLFRDFTWIYNPFKNTNLREYILDGRFLAGEQPLTEEKVNAFIVKLCERDRFPQFMSELSERLGKMVSDWPTTLVHQLCLPKIFDKQYASKDHLERRLMILKENGSICPVEDRSSLLRDMHMRIASETHFRVYLVGRNIKKNHDLKGSFDHTIRDVLGQKWQSYYNGDVS
jgi:HD superfamily phosphohydrolase